MAQAIRSERIESIDVLRGLVMVIMALDHVRVYFYFGSFTSEPTDLDTTTPLLFLTRFVTHFCAPTFIFLTGTSASLFGQNKSKKALSTFLWTRGLWLIFVEAVIMNFLWWFNPAYELFVLQVIWAIGICMILLAGLIYVPKKILIIISVLIIFTHNMLDHIIAEGSRFSSILWYIFHQQQILISENQMVGLIYPIVPWFAVMALGYCFGSLYHKGYDQNQRKKILLTLSISMGLIFFMLRGINSYGDMSPWSAQNNGIFTLLSFINVTKYPPSLLYLLVTLGPAFLVLYFLEDIKTKWTEFLKVFGRVPFFYYILHIFVIHLAALITHVALGGDWTLMIYQPENFTSPIMADYGYPLWVVYLVWILIVAFLYPICKRYMRYKLINKDKRWLSYL